MLDQNLDVAGIPESHLQGTNVLLLDHYKWFGFNRTVIHKNAWHGSGCVGFLVKTNYNVFIN